MTDVKGAGHISANQGLSFDKKHTEKEQDIKKAEQRTEEPDKLLDSLDAMSAYNHPKINRSQGVKGEYKYNPKNTEKDVIVFQENYEMVKEASKDFMKKLLNEGYSAEQASKMAGEFASNLMLLNEE